MVPLRISTSHSAPRAIGLIAARARMVESQKTFRTRSFPPTQPGRQAKKEDLLRRCMEGTWGHEYFLFIFIESFATFLSCRLCAVRLVFLGRFIRLFAYN